MIRKMKITDEDGNKYEVEEEIVSDEVVEENPAEQVPEHEHVDEPAKLTDDEIKALKDLAACAPELMGLLKKPAEDEEIDPAEQPAEEVPEEPAEEVEDEEMEEPVDPEKKKIGDSAQKGVGAKVKKIKDSNISMPTADDVNAAWAKRFSK